MSRLRTSFVLGYHGCEREIGERVLNGEPFKADFDWLGPGAYFWESDPERAEDWARNRPGDRAFKEPFVIGAVDLRNCLDLTTRHGIAVLQASFDSFQSGLQKAKLPMPTNDDVRHDLQKDKLLRRLDNAVIRHLHQNLDDGYQLWLQSGATTAPPPEPFDTVRGLFPEGAPAYEGAGILIRTHTQIAVRNPDCILGVFRRRDHQTSIV